MSAQRNKFRREFSTRTVSGAIVEVADNLAVDVTMVGASFSNSVSIVDDGATHDLQVYHPGRVAVGHYGRILYAATGLTSQPVKVDTLVMSAGVWTIGLSVVATGAGNISVTQYDRLVLEEGGSITARPTLYLDDTSLGNVFTNYVIPTGEAKADANGVLEFFTNEWDLDLKLVQQNSVTNVYGYITDVAVGGRRSEINVQEFGARTQSTPAGIDSWSAIQAAILYAEDDNTDQARIRFPAGAYYITQPLVVTNERIAMDMDIGTTILRHNNWSGAADDPLLHVTGNLFRLDGDGYFNSAGASSGVSILVEDCSYAEIKAHLNNGATGLKLDGCTHSTFYLQCLSQTNQGVWLENASDNTFIAPQMTDIGDAITDAAFRFVYDAAGTCYRNTIVSPAFTRCRNDIKVDGDAADQSRIDGIAVSDMRTVNCTHNSIAAAYCKNFHAGVALMRTTGGVGIVLTHIDGFVFDGVIDNNITQCVSVGAGCTNMTWRGRINTAFGPHAFRVLAGTNIVADGLDALAPFGTGISMLAGVTGRVVGCGGKGSSSANAIIISDPSTVELGHNKELS